MPAERNKNRRFHSSRNALKSYIGHCKGIEVYLSGKNSTGWLIPKFVNALFRGVSQVAFVNNPFSGLIILISLFWSDALVGLAALVAAVSAIFTALIFKQDSAMINSGLTTYNAVLVGSVTASLWKPIYAEDMTLKIWLFIILGSIVSVFLTSAFSNILSSYKISLPCLTLPFNIVAILLFMCLMPPTIKTPTELQNYTVVPDTLNQQEPLHTSNSTFEKFTSTSDISLPSTSTSAPLSISPVVAPYLSNRMARHINANATLDPDNLAIPPSKGSQNATVSANSSLLAIYNDNISRNENETDSLAMEDRNDVNANNTNLNWGKIFSGIICSMGQVYGINNLFSSILIYIAVMIYSPLLCFMFFTGSTIASTTGLLFEADPFEFTYNGIWGYNGILSAGAIGGFFIVLTCHSFWTAVVNVLFTILIQKSLTSVFAPMRLPVFTLPFVLGTLIFLSVTSSGDQLPRVDNISFPEMHRSEFLEKGRKKLNENAREEKELVLEDMKAVGVA